MTFFIPIWAFRIATGFLVALIWLYITWKFWSKPEDAKGLKRWTYIVALYLMRIIYTLKILFDIIGIFPFPE